MYNAIMAPKFNLDEGVVPLSDFRQKTRKYLHRLQDSGEMMILTQNGQSAAVVMSPESYQRLEYERDFFRAIAAGERDAAAGKTIDHDDLFAELLTRGSADRES